MSVGQLQCYLHLLRPLLGQFFQERHGKGNVELYMLVHHHGGSLLLQPNRLFLVCELLEKRKTNKQMREKSSGWVRLWYFNKNNFYDILFLALLPLHIREKKLSKTRTFAQINTFPFPEGNSTMLLHVLLLHGQMESFEWRKAFAALKNRSCHLCSKLSPSVQIKILWVFGFGGFFCWFFLKNPLYPGPSKVPNRNKS